MHPLVRGLCWRPELASRQARPTCFSGSCLTALAFGPGVRMPPGAPCRQVISVRVPFRHCAVLRSRHPQQQEAALANTLRHMACQMLRRRGTWAQIKSSLKPRSTAQVHVFRLSYLLSCIRLAVPEPWALDRQCESPWSGCGASLTVGLSTPPGSTLGQPGSSRQDVGKARLPRPSAQGRMECYASAPHRPTPTPVSLPGSCPA